MRARIVAGVAAGLGLIGLLAPAPPEALACTGRPVGRAGVVKPRIDVLGALNVLRSPATGCG